MHTRTLARALGLSLALLCPPALAQNADPLLSGTTAGQRWSLYKAGPLPAALQNRLALSAPQGAQNVRASYDPRGLEAVLTYSGSSAKDAFAHHDAELRRQGYQRFTQVNADARTTGLYRQGDREVSLQVEDDDGRIQARLRLAADQRVERVPQNTASANQNTSSEGNIRTTTNQNAAAGNANAKPNNPPSAPSGTRPAANATLLREKRGDATVLLTPAPQGGGPSKDRNTVHLVLPPNASVVGEAKGGDAVRVTVRSNLDLSGLQAYYRQQFQRTGFAFSTNTDANSGSANGENLPGGDAQEGRVGTEYQRGDQIVRWSAERQQNGSYLLVFDLGGSLRE